MGYSDLFVSSEMDMLFQTFAGIVGFICFSRIYFLITRGTGKIAYFLIALFVCGFFIKFSGWLYIIIPILLVLLLITELINRKNQIQFEEVHAIFEGGGIRRGLTPPEAAILLGRPFHLITAVTLVYMLEKKILKLESISKHNITIPKQLQTYSQSLNHKKRSEIRRQEAQKLGIILHPYEELILELFEQEADKSIKDYDFGILTKPWIEGISKRMEGYDLAQSRDYYQREIQTQKGLSWVLMREDWNEAIEKIDIHPNWFSENEGNLRGWLEMLISDLKESTAGQDLIINFSLTTN